MGLTYYHDQEQSIGAISFRCFGILSLQEDIYDDRLQGGKLAV